MLKKSCHKVVPFAQLVRTKTLAAGLKFIKTFFLVRGGGGGGILTNICRTPADCM